jgi:hypothetical protein
MLTVASYCEESRRRRDDESNPTIISKHKNVGEV